MRHRLTKKRVLGLAVLAIALFGVAAYAYFTTTGGGTGSATVGTSSAFSVASDPATGNPLVPTAIGDANAELQTIAYSVTNTQEGNQYLHQVIAEVDPTWSFTASGHPACTAADFSINGQAAGSAVTLSKNVNLLSQSDSPANVYSSSITIQMVENSADQDSCKGQTVPLLFHAS